MTANDSAALDDQGDLYYRHTGHAPFAGTTLAAILSWIAVAVLGAAYAYADLYIKVADKLSIVITMAFAAAMGFTVFGVLRFGKVRNTAVVWIIAITSALLAVYASWVVWEFALYRQAGHHISLQGLWRLFRQPNDIFLIAQGVNQEGTFSLSSSGAVKGTELWACWGFEALIIAGCTALIPIAMMRDLAFCETCSRWCGNVKGVLRLQPTNEDLLRERLETRDIKHLLGLNRANSETPTHLRVDLDSCPSCKETRLLSVSRVAVAYNNKNHRNESAKKIIKKLWIGADDVEAIKSYGAPAPAQKVAGAATLRDPAASSMASEVTAAPVAPARSTGIGLGSSNMQQNG